MFFALISIRLADGDKCWNECITSFGILVSLCVYKVRHVTEKNREWIWISREKKRARERKKYLYSMFEGKVS